MSKVIVFMTTYNGKKYVEEQVNSIFSQKNVDVFLAIRDDCSTDGTQQVLERLNKKYSGRIFILYGEKNIFPNGMGELIKCIDWQQYDYIAFSDQDDYWMEDKISCAISYLNKLPYDTPNLYYSNLKVTDSCLNPLFNVYGKNKIKSTYKSCFVDFSASGNTYVINKEAMKLLYDDTKKPYFYRDVWLQLRCFFIGNVVYDDVPHILFRRTGENVSGPRPRGIKLWIYRFGKIKEEKKKCYHMHKEMAKSILFFYGDRLSDDQKKVLSRIADYDKSIVNKIKLLFSFSIRSKSLSKNICFKGRILLNLL